jgi:hypothetical protein
MSRFTSWIAERHKGQIILLAIPIALATTGAALSFVFSISAFNTAQFRLSRATDYSGYYQRSEQDLSDALLWERKVDEGFQKREATAYVIHRLSHAPDSTPRPPIADPLPELTADVRRAMTYAALAAIAIICLLSVEWVVLWYWFDGKTARRRAPLPPGPQTADA